MPKRCEVLRTNSARAALKSRMCGDAGAGAGVGADGDGIDLGGGTAQAASASAAWQGKARRIIGARVARGRNGVGTGGSASPRLQWADGRLLAGWRLSWGQTPFLPSVGARNDQNTA